MRQLCNIATFAKSCTPDNFNLDIVNNIDNFHIVDIDVIADVDMIDNFDIVYSIDVLEAMWITSEFLVIPKLSNLKNLN